MLKITMTTKTVLSTVNKAERLSVSDKGMVHMTLKRNTENTCDKCYYIGRPSLLLLLLKTFIYPSPPPRPRAPPPPRERERQTDRERERERERGRERERERERERFTSSYCDCLLLKTHSHTHEKATLLHTLTFSIPQFDQH